MTEQTKKKLKDYTLEELRERFAELVKGQRQHGRKGNQFEDPKAEWKRLYNNIASIESRNRRKEYQERQDKSFAETYGFGADDADKFGIRPWQRRMYTKLFKSCPYGSIVQLSYVKRMTALTLDQIYALQQETGLLAHPCVSAKQAKADKKYRDDNGIYL